MRRLLTIIVALAVALTMAQASTVAAQSRTVRCDRGADLQAAIDRASSGDTLNVRGTCRGNFLIIGKHLTIRGRGPGATLHGGGSGATLMIDHDGQQWHTRGSKVRLKSLTITGAGGADREDSAVYAWGRLAVLTDVVVRDNGGHGISGDVGRLTLQRSKVLRNGGDGVGRAGDGFRVWAYRSVVRDNGGVGIGASTVVVGRSVVRDNDLRGVAADQQGLVRARHSVVAGNGGYGIDSQGIRLFRTTVRGNGGGVRGGWVDNETGWVRIDRSTIRGNLVPGDGGGLHCWGGCIVTDSRIIRNAAAGDGGGLYLEDIDDQAFPNKPILTVIDSSITGNRAGGSGGGIFNASSLGVVLVDVQLQGNSPNDCSGC